MMRDMPPPSTALFSRPLSLAYSIPLFLLGAEGFQRGYGVCSIPGSLTFIPVPGEGTRSQPASQRWLGQRRRPRPPRSGAEAFPESVPDSPVTLQ